MAMPFPERGSERLSEDLDLIPDEVPLVHPSIPDPDRLADDVRTILASGILTNGAYVRTFEERTAEYLGVRHVVAVASCTAGLMLVLRAAEVTGDVVVPSFTFAATAHAVSWNGLRPVFADVDAETLTLSPQAVARAAGVRTSAILATHVYGTPCDVESLAEVARQGGMRLFFDAAHAFGSRRGERMVGGFGDAEVFSLSPTKVMVAGEGGLIATNDDAIAERCRIGRDYGNPGDYDCIFVGLNARMSEFHAALGLASMDGLDERIDHRNRLAAAYRERLGPLPGVSFPEVRVGDRSTYKDFTLLVDAGQFGMDADELQSQLAADGVDTRRYYSPPVHRMKAYKGSNGTTAHLPVTEDAAGRVLTLPLWSDMTIGHIERVAGSVRRAQEAAEERRKDTVKGP